jgi:hypothetical protein
VISVDARGLGFWSFSDKCSQGDRTPVKRWVTSSTALQMDHNGLGQRSPRSRSVTSGHCNWREQLQIVDYLPASARAPWHSARAPEPQFCAIS